MKKILFLIMAIGIFSCGDDDEFKVDCLPTNLQNGVIAFYPFSDGNINDQSNFDNNLINVNSTNITTDRNGNTDCAYIFDNLGNLDNHLKTSNTNFLNGLKSFSISLWYAPIKTPSAGLGYEVLLGRGEFIKRCPDRRGEWSLGLSDGKSSVFGHNNSVWGSSYLQNYPDEISEDMDVWHHVVSIKDNEKYSIYVDGALMSSDEGNANCGNVHFALDEGDMYIGKLFSGKIDDIIIYNRTLTETEIIELFGLDTCCE